MQVAGSSMKYSRLDQSFAAKMVLARRRQDIEEMQKSASLSAKIVDVLVKSSDFKLGEPQRGDKIEMTTGRVFEVRSQLNLPCWEWSDPRHTFMRIHTVEQEAVTPIAITATILNAYVNRVNNTVHLMFETTPSTGAIDSKTKWTITNLLGRTVSIVIAETVTVTDPFSEIVASDVTVLPKHLKIQLPTITRFAKLTDDMQTTFEATDSSKAVASATSPVPIVTILP